MYYNGENSQSPGEENERREEDEITTYHSEKSLYAKCTCYTHVQKEAERD